LADACHVAHGDGATLIPAQDQLLSRLQPFGAHRLAEPSLQHGNLESQSDGSGGDVLSGAQHRQNVVRINRRNASVRRRIIVTLKE
jgi:hypothetical protein